MMKIAAKKSLGQNFLNAPHVISFIVVESAVQKGETVLEVGPGKGALTEALLRAGARVIAVEKDRRLIPELSKKFQTEIQDGRLSLIEGDILDFDPSLYKLKAISYKLIANIPYYITGAFLKKFLSSTHKPSCMLVMLQKEVAERIVAKNGKESILSLSVKVFGNVKLLRIIPRAFFSPSPNVDSALLRIDSISNDFFKNLDEETFFEIIKTGFSQKRKKLVRTLEKAYAPADLLKAFALIGLKENIRPEDLSLSNWKELAGKLAKKTSRR